MSNIHFPQTPIADADGYISLEWQQWLLNPQVLTLTFAAALEIASGGTGAITAAGARTTLGVPAGSGTATGTNTGDQTNITGNAATVTTNANLTGPITSAGNATAIASQTGAGTKFVVDTTPTLISPLVTGTVSLPNTGAGATCGQLTLIGGTKTINTTAATATCLIFFQRKTNGGTIGFETTYTVNAGVSFTVSSDNILDTSIYNWLIIETH